MLAYVYVILAVLFRLVPHPSWPNFTPVAAALLFFGTRRPAREFWCPVLLLAVSDVLLTVGYYHARMNATYLVTWAWYAAIIWLGSRLCRSARVPNLLLGSLAASVSFFLLSNFSVWALGSMYPKTWSGLATCYLAGVPFFRNTATGDLLFTAALFGLPALWTALRHPRVRKSQLAA